MGIYAVLSKRGVIAVTAFLIICALIFGEYYSAVASQRVNAQSNTQRLDYIYSLGVEVSQTPVAVQNISIPVEFSDVYTAYNAVQLRAGFDLREFRGKEVTKYSYRVINDENIVVNLLVFKDRVIGGDVSSVNINGFMDPLIKKEN